MSVLRILLVDDHAMVRAGIKVLIDSQSDMRVVAEAGTIAEALAMASDCAPEIILLDISLRGQSGLRAVERFKTLCPKARILILTMHDEETYFRAAMAAGCAGYIVKSAADKDLINAIRTVRAGRPFVFLTEMSESAPRPERPAVVASSRSESAILSTREGEVLNFLIQGYTNQQCADRLFVSVKTVETYRQRLGRKLGLRSRADLVRYGIEMGIFTSATEDRELPPT